MIKVTYAINADEMTHASMAFLDLKPFSRFAIVATNIGAVFILAIISLKIITAQIAPFEYIIAAVAILWLFFRKRLNRWLLGRRIQRQRIDEKNVTITFSNNGIIWEGAKLKEGHIPWQTIKICYQLKEGFILPTSSTRFLWLPFHGYDSEENIERFKALLTEKSIEIVPKEQY